LFTYVLPLENQLSREKSWNPINRFNPRHIFIPVPRQDMDFQLHISCRGSTSFVFTELRGEVIVRFVNISGIVNHHFLIIFFIKTSLMSYDITDIWSYYQYDYPILE